MFCLKLKLKPLGVLKEKSGNLFNIDPVQSKKVSPESHGNYMSCHVIETNSLAKRTRGTKTKQGRLVLETRHPLYYFEITSMFVSGCLPQ